MTTTFLLLILVMAGQPQPLIHREEVPTVEACEHLAHEFNVAPLPSGALMGGAACMRVRDKGT